MDLSPGQASARCREFCSMAPVIPVLVIDDESQATPLARTLVGNGLCVLEVTLRTPAALGAIRRMSEIAGSIVGAGTVITPADVSAAKAAGARFAVSPGATDQLLEACEATDLPLLPGAATATEAMRLLARGYDMLKFFPALVSGGVPELKAIGAPPPGISFCPTGGIDPRNAGYYLALKNVTCVGGSWIAPPELVNAGKWDEVALRAKSAGKFRKY